MDVREPPSLQHCEGLWIPLVNENGMAWNIYSIAGNSLPQCEEGVCQCLSAHLNNAKGA